VGDMHVIDAKGTTIDGAEASCLGCENTVILALTGRGAMLPLDPVPSPGGALAVSVPAPGQAPRVRYLRGEDADLAAGERRMVAHWDTHPACKGDRKARKHGPRKVAARPRPALMSSVPDVRDLTLEQLATVELGELLARAGAARPPVSPGPTFGSSI
jgi:hypothetical protein